MRSNPFFCLILGLVSTPILAQSSISFSQTGETVATPGSPFQAERISRTSRTLSDGNQILQEQHETIARDSQGRFYDESKQTSSGGIPKDQPNVFHVLIDPVAMTSTSWNTLSNNGNVQHLSPTTHVVVGATQGLGDNATRHLRGDDIKITTEDLGKKTIAGLPCTGVRTTTTIPVARIGNAHPIKLVSDRWTSADLQMTVLEVDDDPLNGTRTSEFTTASRTEPPASLFKVPEGLNLRNPVLGGIAPITR